LLLLLLDMKKKKDKLGERSGAKAFKEEKINIFILFDLGISKVSPFSFLHGCTSCLLC